MCGLLIIFSVGTLWIVAGHCDTIILGSEVFAIEPDNSYAWIIPPKAPGQPVHQTPLYVDRSPPTLHAADNHPPVIRRYSDEQLNLPNEFLVSPAGGDRQAYPSVSPATKFNSVNFNDATDNHRIEYQRTPLVQGSHDPNGVLQKQGPAVRLPSDWLSHHGGGVGLLFFVPDTAAHLPTQELIRHHLGLHRAHLPFDILMNCHDTNLGCYNSGVLEGEANQHPAAQTAFNVHDVQGVNYDSPGIAKTVNGRADFPQGLPTVGELVARQQQQRHMKALSIQP